MILTLLIWLLAPLANIYIDRKGKKPNYGIVITLRAIAAVAHGILFDMLHNYFPTEWSNISIWETILIYLPLLLFQVTSFWIVFQFGLNIVTKRDDLFYYDHKENDSGLTDRIFSILGRKFYIFCMILASIVCVISIIVLYKSV